MPRLLSDTFIYKLFAEIYRFGWSCHQILSGELYTPAIDTMTTRAQFVSLLEQLFYEIYDHHANLNTNNLSSRRLVPSGTDIWAEYVDGKPMVIQVRKKQVCWRAWK